MTEKLNPVLNKQVEDTENTTGLAFYKYDCIQKEYQFISPSIRELIGYTPGEINLIGFEQLIRNQLVEKRNEYPLNENENDRNIIEYFVTYLIETKTGELKWIEEVFKPLHKDYQ
jgi:PAS domain-containing protein